MIVSFSGNYRVNFSVLARILRVPGTALDSTIVGIHTDGKLFRDSSGQFFNTRTDATGSRYWPGFYHFSVLTLMVSFSGTRRVSFSVLARILPDPGTGPDSTIFRYSHKW